MKIAITGSGGMIGTCLQNHLSEQGHEVAGLHRGVLDLTDVSAVDNFFQSQSFDLVIHGALYGRETVRNNQIDMYDVNMQMFNNLHAYRHRYKKLINLGSGTEYDTSRNIDHADENDIYLVDPANHYDRVKNHISRICCDTENFITLRMFGVMSHTEASNRFFKHLYESDRFVIKNDRYFDFINLEDLLPVVDAVINGQITDKQLNIVYAEKIKLSELARMFCSINKLNYDKIVIDSPTGLNYTGKSDLLDKYQITQTGIQASMEKYQ